MENLWKTVDDASAVRYVNIFEITSEKFGTCFREWNVYINEHANQLKSSGSYNKSNQKAEKLLWNGHEFSQNGNYRGAMQKYNECLNYAESGTVWER